MKILINKIPDSFKIKCVNAESFKPYMKECCEALLKSYRDRINEYNIEIKEDNLEIFPLAKQIKFKIIYKNTNIELYLFHSDKMIVEHYTFQFKTIREINDFSKLPKFIQDQKIKEVIGISDEPIEKIILNYGHPLHDILGSYLHFSEDPTDMLKIGEFTGRNLADTHVEKSRNKIINIVKPSFIDVDMLIKRVNDKNFEYEFKEAFYAYQQGLYLAAMAVSRIALETMLKVASKNKEPKRKGLNDTLEEPIFNTRELGFLTSLRQLRNTSSYSNEDDFSPLTVKNVFESFEEVSKILFSKE